MVLALLREADMHPYEMVRLLRMRRDERLVKVTNGTLYHCVNRMLEQGLIEKVGTDREGNRPERTTYALTDAGHNAMHSWIREELSRIDRPAQFRVALAEAHNVERDDAVALLRIRRVALADEAQIHRDGFANARDKGVPAQFLIEIERQQALLDAEVVWLDALLSRLGADEIPWGSAGHLDTDRYLAQRKAAAQ
nr:PadR family transcriptional regulator [Microbacterium pseudoresistens]